MELEKWQEDIINLCSKEYSREATREKVVRQATLDNTDCRGTVRVEGSVRLGDFRDETRFTAHAAPEHYQDYRTSAKPLTAFSDGERAPAEYNRYSLDKVNHKSHHGVWDKKRKRCYMRALSGCKRYMALGKWLGHLTLTSSPSRCKYLKRDWDVFLKRIRRELDYRLQYLKVETNEGYGVLHVILIMDKFFRRGYYARHPDVFHAYFSAVWSEIHDSPNVWCSICYRYNDYSARDLTKYLITQYVVNQDGYLRMSHSRDWCFFGFVRKFREIIKEYGFKNGIIIWGFLLKKCQSFKYTQKLLFKKTVVA